MESGLNPTNSRKPISRLRTTLGAGLIVHGLTITLGPTGIFLVVTAFPRQFSLESMMLWKYLSIFDQETIITWQYRSIFGLFLYWPLGLVMVVIGLGLRQSVGWLIGVGLTITFSLMLIFFHPRLAFLRNDTSLFKRFSLVSPDIIYLTFIGLVIVGIGLWVRQRSLR
jgi:hypothetical protein